MSIVERALAKASARGRAAANPDGGATGAADKRIVGATQPLKGEPAHNGLSIDISPEVLRAEGSPPSPDMEAQLAEELRLIKRPLLINAEAEVMRGMSANTLMIASALPGAGKTFISLNLAVSMAQELDWTVLLVDADVTRPTLSRRLGVADAPGLVTLLEQEAREVSELVYKTSVPGLQVLPAGPSRPNVKELLGSQRMRSLVADLTERHDRRIVIFDSPPLLLTSEARVLASYVGQIVLVVEAGVTPRRSVLEAIETLDPTKAINLVLNKSRQKLGMGDYQYAGYAGYARQTVTSTQD